MSSFRKWIVLKAGQKLGYSLVKMDTVKKAFVLRIDTTLEKVEKLDKVPKYILMAQNTNEFCKIVRYLQNCICVLTQNHVLSSLAFQCFGSSQRLK